MREQRGAVGVPGVVGLVAAGVALLASGCGDGPKAPTVASLETTASTASSGSPPTSAVPWAQHMNSHGIPASADPGGYYSMSPDTDARSPRFQRAAKAYQDQELLPVIDQGGGGPRSKPHAGVQMLKFSTCMRKHGVPNVPEPKLVNGLWSQPGLVGSGIDFNSQQVQAARKACQGVAPGHIAHGG